MEVLISETHVIIGLRTMKFESIDNSSPQIRMLTNLWGDFEKGRQHLEIDRVDPEKKCSTSLSKVSCKALSPTPLVFYLGRRKGKKKK